MKFMKFINLKKELKNKYQKKGNILFIIIIIIIK